MPKFNRIITLSSFAVAWALAANSAPVLAQAKHYRGAIGDSHIEMRLNISGNKITGTYSYDRIGQDIRLDGQLDNQGRLQLFELDQKNKPSAKIICKNRLDDQLDPECMWSRLDGSREVFVSLHEQNVAFDGLTVVPKMISDRKLGINVSYPQITNGSKPLTAGAQSFNRAALASVQKAIKEFGAEPDGGSYDINYIVLFGANDLISVEFEEDSYLRGAAHPNVQYWAITFDLNGNKAVDLKDLFRADVDFKPAIAKAAVEYINARADALEKSEAAREGRKAEPRDGPLYSEEELPDPNAWGITPRGLMIYFDFPHVAAYFDRTFVPYGALKQHLRPDGPATRFQ